MSAAIQEAETPVTATIARLPVRRVLIVGLVAVGLIGSIVGPALPGIRETFGLSLGTAGLLVVASATGYITGALVSGFLADRYDRRLLLAIAAGLLAAGAAGMGLAPSWSLLLGSAALFGAGGGIVDGPGNAMVNEHSGLWRTADLNLAHGFFGVGSIAGPLIGGLALAASLSWHWLVLPGVVAAFVMLWLVTRLQLPAPHHATTQHATTWRVLAEPLVILLAIILCLYVGVEVMIGTWAFSYLRERFDASDAAAGLATALYWGGLTLGRLLAGTIGAHIGPHALIVGNAVGAALALCLVVTAPTLPFAMLGLGLIGLALANIFPAVLAIGGAAYPAAGGTVSGGLAAAGGIGGAIVPWGAGMLAERVGLGTALATGLLLLALMLATEGAVIWLCRRQSGSAATTNYPA